jgi:3-hydroxyisobutyrate dehydrogenase-like beta-hydroxyacid dehydrogenase
LQEFGAEIADTPKAAVKNADAVFAIDLNPSVQGVRLWNVGCDRTIG